MPKSILNINLNNQVSAGQIVDIQFQEINPVDVSGFIRTAAGVEYNLIHVSIDHENSRWRVQVPLNIPITPVTDVSGWQLVVSLNHGVYFSQNLQDVVVSEGSDAIFTIGATDYTSISWFFNGAVVQGESGLSLTLASTDTSMNNSTVYAVLNDAHGNSRQTLTKTLQVNEVSASGPQITTQPIPTTVDSGQSFSFSVVASNATSYQWQKNGVDISGANSSTYTGTALVSNDGANYRCVIGGNGQTIFSSAVTLSVNVVSNGETVIEDKTVNASVGADKIIIVGPASTVNGVINYTVTGSDKFIAGPASNEITFNTPLEDTEILNVVGDDGNGWTDSGIITINVSSAISIIPLQVTYRGWSTMETNLDGINTGDSTTPSDEHNPSLFTLVGQMYAANGLGGYVYDWEFMAQPDGSKYIDAPEAYEHVNSTSADAIVFSAYGNTAGIIMEPADANATPDPNGNNGWIERMANISEAAADRNIKPIMYQCWGSANQQNDFDHAKINTDALQARFGMLVIRSAEIVEALKNLNPVYVTNVDAPNGKYSTPVTTLYSGALNDSFHGSYAMQYMGALATFKCLTGISAADNAFVIPSGGASGDKYGMSEQFISDIKTQVDLIQRESLISGLEEGAAPIANNFSRNATHDVLGRINVVSASNLIDDVPIVLANLTIKTINAAHFSSHDLTNGIFTFTPVDSFTGDSIVVFTYTDADAQSKDISVTLNIGAAEVVPPEEIIINFGFGDGNSFSENGTLYNHSLTGDGKTINHVRHFDSAGITNGDLKDSEGVGTGSVTSLAAGLSGLGYTGNENPVVHDYGPYSELYANQAAAVNNETVSFSINGLEAGKNYRVECGGYWGSDITNLVSVDVNGVQGEFDCDARGPVEFEKVVKVDSSGKLTFSIKSKDNVSLWGLSYVWLNKITDNTPADIPAKPVFTIHPQNVSSVQGTLVSFSASASGAPSYQWYFNGQILHGITAPTYSRTLEPSDDNGLVTVEAINGGGTTISNAGTITLIQDAPVVTVNPVANVTLIDGDNLIISIEATGATSYQWRKNGVDIAGETSPALNISVSVSDNNSNYSCFVSNAFGDDESTPCLAAVSARKQEYWFSLGRNDGRASSFELTDNAIPDVRVKGNSGEGLNFIRDLAPHGAPVTRANIWRDISETVTDLSITYNSIGTNTATIDGWGEYQSDIDNVASVVTKLTNKNIWQHKNLFGWNVYLAENNAFELTFENGGLIVGETWKIQLLGLHYLDVNRPVDVVINGVGESGNMHVGDWETLDLFEALTTVDQNGKIVLSVSPQINANLNAIKLIKV